MDYTDYFGLILILFLVHISGVVYIGTQQSKLEVFLVKTWSELEDSRRIIVQDQLACCGLESTTDSTLTSSTDSSCFENNNTTSPRRPDCLTKLKKWLKSNIYITAGSAGALAMIEILVLVCLVIVIRSKESSAANNRVHPINVQPSQQEYDTREKITNQSFQSTSCRSPNYGYHGNGLEDDCPPRKLWQPQRKNWAKKESRSAGVSKSTKN